MCVSVSPDGSARAMCDAARSLVCTVQSQAQCVGPTLYPSRASACAQGFVPRGLVGGFGEEVVFVPNRAGFAWASATFSDPM
jgi:hypothetical protein